MNTRLAVLQMESVLGDVSQNAQKILDAAAKCSDAEILITPELALTGFVADYFLDRTFLNNVQESLASIAKEAQERFPHLSIIVGAPFLKNDVLLNAALLIHNGAIQKIHAKKPEGLEKRYFSDSEHADIFAPIFVKDLTVSFTPPPLVASVALKSAAFNHAKTPAQNPNQVFLNRLGLEVPFIFTGDSHAFDKKGEKIWQAPAFAESLAFLNLQNGELILEGEAPKDFEESAESRIWKALTFALKKYAEQNAFKTAVVGLSGGIDSGVVLALAVDALGAENVTALILPSPFTSAESLEDATAIAQNLNVLTVEIAITPLMKAYEKSLAKPFKKLKAFDADTTFENLQARIRGQLIMAYSNRSGAVVLNTSNKSESAVGYSTLYGDLIGGIAPIKDLYKTQIFALAKFRNTLSPAAPVIPQRMISKPPSAELKPNQKDEDSLPPYALLDSLLVEMIEGEADEPTLLQKGFAAHIIKDVGARLRRAEFKRRQAPAGFVMSERGFDWNWNYPLGAQFGENE